MPISVRRKDERGKPLQQHKGYLLLERLEGEHDGSVCYRFIDPYGDAVFNQAQLPYLADEIERAVAAAAVEGDRLRLRVVASFVRRARAKLHTYVRFLRD